MPVDLGFVEKCAAWRLESRFFPSKVGGKPAWLDLEHIPGREDLACEYCNEPCVFLCQVYAPYEEDETAFHRTIYVFICRKPDCCKPNENGNLKVFRSQLQRDNKYFTSEAPIERENWQPDIGADRWTKTCYVCGIRALSRCAKCKIINYCCRSHQIYDWKHRHKETCFSDQVSSLNSTLLFPQYELVIETEDSTSVEEDEDDNSDEDEAEIKKYEAMVTNDKGGTMQQEDVDTDLLKMANNEDDEVFQNFKTKVDHYSDQVLRYNRGGEVLYISSSNQVDTVPRCTNCNGERQFEFQVMPQLLNFLSLNESMKCIDWGILAVFTCKLSCTPKTGYAKEYIWKQDITEEKKQVSVTISEDT